MNSYDLFKQWGIFKDMIEDPQFTNNEKQSMGEEMLRALPPEMLCQSSKSTLNAIILAMQSRLTDIGNNDGRNTRSKTEETTEEADPSSGKRKERSRKKPL